MERTAGGREANGAAVLSPVGSIVADVWSGIPAHFPGVRTDAFVVMPDHVHGIIVIDRTARGAPMDDDRVGARFPRPLNAEPHPRTAAMDPTGRDDAAIGARGPRSNIHVGRIIAWFKYQSTKRINRLRGAPGTCVWQRNFHDRIIRDAEALHRIRKYIRENPAHWIRGR
jgi:REP element-mobilizing transposase RayT